MVPLVEDLALLLSIDSQVELGNRHEHLISALVAQQLHDCVRLAFAQLHRLGVPLMLDGKQRTPEGDSKRATAPVGFSSTRWSYCACTVLRT